MYVFKAHNLPIGKRLTWHLERANNHYFNLASILDNLENLSYPISLKLQDDVSLHKAISTNAQLVYNQNTIPKFFYSEYKVAILADLSQIIHNFKINQNN